MAGYTAAAREEDPVQIVRTIARLAQMLVELRDEYVDRPRVDTLHQIEQRLDDLIGLREDLRSRVQHAARTAEQA